MVLVHGGSNSMQHKSRKSSKLQIHANMNNFLEQFLCVLSHFPNKQNKTTKIRKQQGSGTAYTAVRKVPCSRKRNVTNLR